MLSIARKWAMGFGMVVLLVFTPSFVLAQDPYDEIPKLQARYERLTNELITSQKRSLSSARTDSSQENVFSHLNTVWQGLTRIDREFTVLTGYKSLASLVTEKQLAPHARKMVESQLDLMKKLNAQCIGYLEKTMHLAGDQETTRLALAARDLHRSSAEILDRLQAPDPTVQ